MGRTLKIMRRAVLGLALAAGVVPAGFAAEAWAQNPAVRIEVEDAWARLPGSGVTRTTAYAKVRNAAESQDRLLGASSPWAESARLMKYVMDGYYMKLSTVPSIPVRAGGSIKLSPSNEFIVLDNLTVDLKPGMKIPIALRFEKAGRVEIEAEVTNQLLGNMDDLR
ncbi:MAG: copper chaperone PCu(A)C [Rhodospirillaceae bacterium]|nr:copper chaperone PCu(A)C [Rhodospirillaceae bacterium]